MLKKWIHFVAEIRPIIGHFAIFWSIFARKWTEQVILGKTTLHSAKIITKVIKSALYHKVASLRAL